MFTATEDVRDRGFRKLTIYIIKRPDHTATLSWPRGGVFTSNGNLITIPLIQEGRGADILSATEGVGNIAILHSSIGFFTRDCIYTKKARVLSYAWNSRGVKKRRWPTLPQLNAVPSARVGLTSLFGMGRGGTPTLWSPKFQYVHMTHLYEINS